MTIEHPRQRTIVVEMSLKISALSVSVLVNFIISLDNEVSFDLAFPQRVFIRSWKISLLSIMILNSFFEKNSILFELNLRPQQRLVKPQRLVRPDNYLHFL